ncbi:MAG: hypothetical protein N0E54_07175 [Candidatus Thiodiazotropha taylori]|nr:hypothetical protein [Candidatus Thiodiazotropha endolucinida]MCW4228501.1 hypothetical protein [Candidatus Thiodiazotropha taylori]
MGVRIIIGTSERGLNDIEPNWINEQIGRRRNEGSPACVRIIIEVGDINLSLATSDCPGSGGVRRKLTRAENEVIDLWGKLNLSEEDFSSGNLVAFLKQLRI